MDAPEHVREWLRVNDDVPADKLKCPVCGEWLASIDHLAPYHWETCWCEKCQNYPMQPKSMKSKTTSKSRRPAPIRSTDGLGDALRILINISDEYMKLCDVMLAMPPERKAELRAADRFMDALEVLRDELLKRKSSNNDSTTPIA